MVSVAPVEENDAHKVSRDWGDDQYRGENGRDSDLRTTDVSNLIPVKGEQ